MVQLSKTTEETNSVINSKETVEIILDINFTNRNF